MNNHFTKITVLLFCFFTLEPLFAENDEYSKVFGDYEVHYSVFNTSFLTPEVASAYKIVRSKELALVNIAIRKKTGNGDTKAVPAIIKGSVRDLIHTTPLEFREVREQDAIYYLSNYKIDNKQTVYFSLSVQPDPNVSPYKLEFSKMLYVD